MTKAAELAKMGEVLTNSQIGGRRNIIINGAMQVAQRGTSATGKTASGIYTVDRMALGISDLGAYTVTQETLTSGNAYNAGFKKAFRVDCTTADASPAADDNIFFQYKIEGQDLNGFKKGTSEAEQFTLQFWVKSNKTGTGQVLLQDKDNGRNVGKTYTISSANTWEHKILTFPADTTGAFDNDNGKSLEIEWALDAGSTFTGGTLPATWTSSNNNQRSVNDFALGDSTDNDWAITGIQLEVGSQATPFEHRSFGEELALCHRYYEKTAGWGYILGGRYNQDTGVPTATWFYKKKMRTSPSVSNTGSWTSGGGWGGAPLPISITDSHVAVYSTTSVSASNNIWFNGGQLILDAEL